MATWITVTRHGRLAVGGTMVLLLLGGRMSTAQDALAPGDTSRLRAADKKAADLLRAGIDPGRPAASSIGSSYRAT